MTGSQEILHQFKSFISSKFTLDPGLPKQNSGIRNSLSVCPPVGIYHPLFACAVWPVILGYLNEDIRDFM